MNGWIDACMHAYTNGLTDEWMDEWMEGRMDPCIHGREEGEKMKRRMNWRRRQIVGKQVEIIFKITRV